MIHQRLRQETKTAMFLDLHFRKINIQKKEAHAKTDLSLQKVSATIRHNKTKKRHILELQKIYL